MLKVIDTLERIIVKAVGALLILILAVLTVSCILQVFTRFVLNNSLTWTEELARYCFIWGGVLGISLAFKEKTHARIGVLVERFPKKVQIFFEGFANLLAIYLSYIFIEYGGEMAVAGMNSTSPQLNIPLGYIYACIPVTGVIILILMVFSFIKFIVKGKEEGKE